MDECCVGDVLSVSELCSSDCRMPWPLLKELDNISAAAIDRQRRNIVGGGPSSTREYPWVGVQQRHTHPSRSSIYAAASPQPLRLAICLAGAVRALVLPKVWQSVQEHVLRASSGASSPPPSLFLVLSTSAEEPRGRSPESEDHDAEQTYLHTREGAQLLAAALNALQPAAVLFLSGRSAHGCGVPASGQFSKWAECAPLVRSYEERNPTERRFDVLWKSRPDLLWYRPRLGLHHVDEIVRRVAADSHLAVTSDDANVFLHRAKWQVLPAMSPTHGQSTCWAECTTHLWKWFADRRVYCLLKANLARFGIHHVDLAGGAAGAAELLQSCALDWTKGSGINASGPGCRELTLLYYVRRDIAHRHHSSRRP